MNIKKLLKVLLLPFVALLLLNVVLATLTTANVDMGTSLDDAHLSGGNPTDESGNGYTLTNNGATTGLPAVMNEGFDFARTNSDYIGTDYQIGSAGSFSVWVNKSSNASDMNIIGVSTSGVADYIRLETRSGTTQLGKIRCIVGNEPLQYLAGMNIDRWYHLVIVWNSSDDWSCWLDGVEVITGSTGKDPTVAYDVPIGVGTLTTGTRFDYFDGMLDEPLFFNYALSDAEIAELYNSGNGYDPFDSSSYTASLDVYYLSPNTSVYTDETDLRGYVERNETITAYVNYTYLVNGVEATSGQYTGSPSGDLYTLPVLSNTYFSQGDNVTFTAFLSNTTDGSQLSDEITSNAVIILNRNPYGILSWTSNYPLNNTNFSATVTPYDDDADNLNITYTVFKNGAFLSGGSTAEQSSPYSNVVLYTVDHTTTNVGDNFTFFVNITDGRYNFESNVSDTSTVTATTNFTITVTDTWSGSAVNNYTLIVRYKDVLIENAGVNTSLPIACLNYNNTFSINNRVGVLGGLYCGSNEIVSTTNSTYTVWHNGTELNYYKINSQIGWDIRYFYNGEDFAGSGSTITSVNTNLTGNITILADDYFIYKAFDWPLNETLSLTMSQSIIRFNATQLFTNNTLSGVTFWVGSVSGNPLNLTTGSKTVIAEKAGYYNKSYTFTVSALDNTTIYVEDLYDAILNITAIKGFDASTVSGFNTSANNSVGAAYNTTSGSYGTLNLLTGHTYLVNWSKTGYISMGVNISVENATQEYQFTVYESVDVQLNFFDEETLNPLTNVTFELLSDAFSNSYDTGASDSLFFDDLPSATYEIRYSRTNYSSRSYFVAIPLLSTGEANLSLYLLEDDLSTLFLREVVDQGINPLTGYYLQVQRPYPSTDNSSTIYRTVELAAVDSQGAAVFNAIANTQQYRFRVLDSNFQLTSTLTDSYLIDTSSQIIGLTSGSPMSNFNAATDATYTLEYVNATGFVFDYTAPNTIYKACLEVITDNGLTKSSTTTCANDYSSTITINPTIVNGSYYLANAYLYPDSNTLFLVDTEDLDKRFAGDRTVLKTIGPFLYVLLMLFCIGVGGYRSPTVAVLMGVVGTAAFSLSFLGLYAFSTYLTGGLLVVGIIILLLLRENR